MKEKPPILSEHQPKEIPKGYPKCCEESYTIGYTIGHDDGSKAQRDADVEWYEKGFAKLLVKIKEIQKIQGLTQEELRGIAPAIQQARTEEREEVAREIFEGIEDNLFEAPLVKAWGIYKDKWRSIKDRYKEKK